MPPQSPARVAVPEMPWTQDVALEINGKGSVAFRIARAADAGQIFFSLGIRKSGSTLLTKMVAALARRNGLNPVDIPHTFFKQGFTVADWSNADLGPAIAPGNVYVGFRTYPTLLSATEAFRGARKVFMFRDPRDALVSQYYSDAYSHSLPSRDTELGRQAAEAFERKRAEALALDVETYVLRHARAMDRTMLSYAGLLSDPTCLALRYEEFVFQKVRMIHVILRHFGWQCPPGAVDALMDQLDQVPKSEDKHRFVRQVIPGDHRKKLTPDTIRQVNNILAESMRVYDYY